MYVSRQRRFEKSDALFLSSQISSSTIKNRKNVIVGCDFLSLLNRFLNRQDIEKKYVIELTEYVLGKDSNQKNTNTNQHVRSRLHGQDVHSPPTKPQAETEDQDSPQHISSATRTTAKIQINCAKLINSLTAFQDKSLSDRAVKQGLSKLAGRDDVIVSKTNSDEVHNGVAHSRDRNATGTRCSIDPDARPNLHDNSSPSVSALNHSNTFTDVFREDIVEDTPSAVTGDSTLEEPTGDDAACNTHVHNVRSDTDGDPCKGDVVDSSSTHAQTHDVDYADTEAMQIDLTPHRPEQTRHQLEQYGQVSGKVSYAEGSEDDSQDQTTKKICDLEQNCASTSNRPSNRKQLPQTTTEGNVSLQFLEDGVYLQKRFIVVTTNSGVMPFRQSEHENHETLVTRALIQVKSGTRVDSVDNCETQSISNVSGSGGTFSKQEHTVTLFVILDIAKTQTSARSYLKKVDRVDDRSKTAYRRAMAVFSEGRRKRGLLASKLDGEAESFQMADTDIDFVRRMAKPAVQYVHPVQLGDLRRGTLSELWRLISFNYLDPLPFYAIRLSQDGLFYDRDGNTVRCFSCGAHENNLNISEARDLGRFHLPNCPHATSRDTRNVPIGPPAVPPAASHERELDEVDIEHDDGEAQQGSAPLPAGHFSPSRESSHPGAPSSNGSDPPNNRSSETDNLALPAPAEDPGLVARHREFAAQSAGTAVPISSISPHISDCVGAFSPNETVDGVNPASSTYMKQSATLVHVTCTTSQVPTVTGNGLDHKYSRHPVQATQRQSSAAQTYRQPNIGAASTSIPSSLHEDPGEEGRRVDAVLIQLDITRAASRQNATARDRLASFFGWLTSSGQTPRALALAGFYYLGSGDSVRCWCCGIILRNWRPFDDPWVTHVLFRFSCDFVIAVRGQNFVTQALVGRGHANTSLSPVEFLPSSGSTDAAATLHDPVRSTSLPEESGSATSTLGGQREWGQTASNSPVNASNNASNSRNASRNRAVRSCVNNNNISKNSDCIQGPLAERNATGQRPSGSEADREQAIAQGIETVTASNSNVGESRSKTSDEEGIATRHANPPEVPGRDSGSAQNNTSAGSGKAARANAGEESGRRESAQSDAQSSRGRDQGSNVGNDTSVPKGPGYQSDVGNARETSSDAGRFAIDGSSAAAPSRDNYSRRPDSAHGKRRGKLFGKWRTSKSKSHKKVIQQTANTADNSSQPNRPSSQIHEGKVDPAEQHSGQSTPSREPGGTDASGKDDVKVSKKEKEKKQSKTKKNMTSYAENAESSVNGQTESSTSRVQNASYGQAARLQAEISSDHVMTASNERQTSSPHTENSTSDLTNASYERQTANLQTQSRATHVDHVSRERRPTDQPRNHASQMLQVDSEAHDSDQGPSWTESTLPRGPDITSSPTETRGTLQRQSSTVPEPAGCRPVSEPPLLHNMEPADRDAVYRRLQEENQRLRARRTCRICRRQTVDTIFLPCGHICSCETCASTVRECCLCFQRIRGTAHVYME